MFSVKTTFVPYRMSSRNPQPVDMEVEIVNRSSSPKLLSVEIRVPDNVALDRGGMIRKLERRLGEVRPGEKKRIVVTIYPRLKVSPGYIPVSILLREHYQSYDYVLETHEKKAMLRVA